MLMELCYSRYAVELIKVGSRQIKYELDISPKLHFIQVEGNFHSYFVARKNVILEVLVQHCGRGQHGGKEDNPVLSKIFFCTWNNVIMWRFATSDKKRDANLRDVHGILDLQDVGNKFHMTCTLQSTKGVSTASTRLVTAYAQDTSPEDLNGKIRSGVLLREELYSLHSIVQWGSEPRWGVSGEKRGISSEYGACCSMWARMLIRELEGALLLMDSSTAGYGQSIQIVECFNCHKSDLFARECRVPRIAMTDRYWNQGNSSKAVRIEDASERQGVLLMVVCFIGVIWPEDESSRKHGSHGIPDS
ncbi:hypothetical protein Tco_1384691 [Tanacetum coccineum]